ncbi:MAG: EpsG family protein [Gammaproteobacteria bacterium]|nr:EpsG family protein [Gammaproteobacteria bacterium]MBU1838166.1 EpsG family protein [Alphaproteobacteria bacterium]
MLASFQEALFGLDPDDINYKIFYENVSKSISFELILSRFEPGYTLYAYFMANAVGASYEEFVLVSAILSISIKLYCFAKLKRPVIVAALYLFSLFFMLELVQVRFALSLSFALLGVELWRRSQTTASIIFLFLAASVHYSVVIFIAFSVLPHIFLQALNRKHILIFLTSMIGLLAIIRDGSFVVDYVSSYNPLIRTYLLNQGGGDLNPINAQSLLFSLLIILGLFKWNNMTIFARRYYLFSLFSLSLYFVFLNSPVIASRVIEASTIAQIYWVTQGLGRSRAGVEIILLTFFSLFRFLDLLIFTELFI